MSGGGGSSCGGGGGSVGLILTARAVLKRMSRMDPYPLLKLVTIMDPYPVLKLVTKYTFTVFFASEPWHSSLNGYGKSAII